MPTFQTQRAVTMRRVWLRVRDVAALERYYGREERLIGTAVEAVELDSGSSVAFVDDRDGEASEIAEAVTRARSTPGVSERALRHFEGQLSRFATRRLLHGDVIGVRR